MSSLSARAAVQALAASKIRELYNEGLGRRDVLAFWVGEPDEPTPQFIRQAATESIAAGEVFYTHNLGIGELRGALPGDITPLHPPTPREQGGGANAGGNPPMLPPPLLHAPRDRAG